MVSPSQDIINAANAVMKATDTRGRVIEVKKLKTLDRMRLFEIIGPENSENDRYLSYAALAYSVVSIDGEPQPTPNNKTGLEGIVQELDDDGFEAVARVMSASRKALPSEDELKAQIKNESSTPAS